MELLYNTKVKQDSDLLSELIAYLVSQITPLDQQCLDENEFKMVESVLILFSKVIKQNAVEYIKLNQAYLQMTELSHQNKLGYIFETRPRGVMHFEGDNNPFLSLLVQLLHCLMQVNVEYCRDAVCHIVNAVTALYDNDELVMKQEIIGLYSRFINQETGGVQIVSFFSENVLDAERQLDNYKATISYLKFLTKVFKRPHPLEFLPEEQAIEFERSLFGSSLERVYFDCMLNYFGTSFIDAASLSKFTTRLCKLTRILLRHFDEIPQSQKAPLCEPLPRFDLMLEFIYRILN